jgi:hypothetical protein
MRPWSSRPTLRAPISSWLIHFVVVTQSFYYIVIHFTATNSSILLLWTKSFLLYFAQSFCDFCYSDSVILWYCELFCYTGLRHFFGRVLRSAIFLQYSVIFGILSAIFLQFVKVLHHFCYSAQSFCYRTRSFYDFVSHSFWMSTMLGHFLLTSVFSHFAIVFRHFLVAIVREVAQSFWKMTELGHGRAGREATRGSITDQSNGPTDRPSQECIQRVPRDPVRPHGLVPCIKPIESPQPSHAPRHISHSKITEQFRKWLCNLANGWAV